MNVKCPKCAADYNVQPDRVPLSGIDMKCSKCLHSFHVSPGDLRGAAEEEPGLPGAPLGLKGVTFLGGKKGGKRTTQFDAASGYFIRANSGQVLGPFEPPMILQMLRTSQLTGNEVLSRDKANWEPLNSVKAFEEFLDMRSGKSQGGNTRFLGRPGSTSPPKSASTLASRAGGAIVLPPPESVGDSLAGLGDLPGSQDNLVGLDFEDDGLSDLDDFSIDMGDGDGGFDPELSGFALGGQVAELPRALGAGGGLGEVGSPPGPSEGGSTGFELEGDFDYDDMDLPDPLGVDAELPVPAGFEDAELPIPAGIDIGFEGAELPGLAHFDEELPSPVDPGYGGFDDAELPVPANFGDAELPAPIGGEAFGDILSINASSAELPRPKELAELPSSFMGDQDIDIGFEDAELPGLVGADEAELPVPAGGMDFAFDDAELPVPAGFDDAELPIPAGLGAELPMLAGGVDLPASVGSELPMLAGGVDLPASVGSELPQAVSLGTFGRRDGVDLPASVASELPAPSSTELPRSSTARPRFGGDAGGGAEFEFDGDDLFEDGFGDDPFAGSSFPPPAKATGASGNSGFRLDDGEDMTMAGGVSYESAFGVNGQEESTVGVDPNEYESVMGVGEDGDENIWGELDDDPGASDDYRMPPPAAGMDAPAPHRVVDTRSPPASPDAAPAPSAVATAEVERAAEGTKAKPKPPAGTSKALWVAIGLLTVALLVVVGMIFTQTDLLGGGVKTAPPEVVKNNNPTEVVAPQTLKANFDKLRPDTHGAYRSFIAEKSKSVASRPNDAGLKGEIVVAQVLYLAHYPKNDTFKGEIEGLALPLKGAKSEGAQLGRGAHAIHKGDIEAAKAELEPMTESKDHAYTAHLLLGLSDLMANRVEIEQAKASPSKGPKAGEPGVTPVKDEKDGAEKDKDAAGAEGGDEKKGASPEDPKDNKDDAAGAKEDKGGDEAKDDAAAEGDKAPVDEDEFDMTDEVLTEEKESQRRKESIKHLEQAAKLDKKAPAPLFFLAEMAHAVSDDKRALAHLDKAIKIAPGHVPSLLKRSRLSYLTAKLKVAEASARPVVEKYSGDSTTRERSEAFLFIGLVHVARRESELAVKALTEALKVDPTNIAALKELGKEFFRNGQYAEALNYFRTNTQLSRKDPEVMLNIVKSHIGLEEYDQAVQMLEAGANAFPTDPQFPYYLGRIHEQRGNWFEAQQGYRKALQIDPGYSRSRVRLAILLLKNNEKKEARKLLEETEELGAAGDAEVAVDVGQAYMMLGEKKKGLKLLRRALTINASNLDARIRLARYYLDVGDVEEAMSLLEPFMEAKTEDVQLSLLLADAFRESKQYERSIEQLDRLVERYPKNATYVFKLGLAYFAWNNFDTARTKFLDAYSLDTSNQEAYFSAGRVEFEQGNYPASMKIFRQVLDEEPNKGAYRYFMGYALEKSGNLTQALEEYNNAERYDPGYTKTNPDLLYRRGRIFAKQGNYRQAKKDLVVVLQHDSKHLGALLSLGDTLADERKPAEAVVLYERALALRDDLPTTHYNLGRNYAILKKRPEALASLQKAVELGIKEPEAYEMQGFLYRDSGNRAAAIKAFEKYLEIDPTASNKREIQREIKRLR